jgi:hypothetical protein
VSAREEACDQRSAPQDVTSSRADAKGPICSKRSSLTRPKGLPRDSPIQGYFPSPRWGTLTIQADRAGLTAFRSSTSPRPARRLSWVDYEAVGESSPHFRCLLSLFSRLFFLPRRVRGGTRPPSLSAPPARPSMRLGLQSTIRAAAPRLAPHRAGPRTRSAAPPIRSAIRRGSTRLRADAAGPRAPRVAHRPLFSGLNRVSLSYISPSPRLHREHVDLARRGVDAPLSPASRSLAPRLSAVPSRRKRSFVRKQSLARGRPQHRTKTPSAP